MSKHTHTYTHKFNVKTRHVSIAKKKTCVAPTYLEASHSCLKKRDANLSLSTLNCMNDAEPFHN